MLEIESKMWAIDAAFARPFEKVGSGSAGIEKIIAAAKAEREVPSFVSLAPSAYSGRETISGSGNEDQQNKVGSVIPIMGVMTRYGDACSWGTEDVSRWIKQADSYEHVDVIILKMDTPGGHVDGTMELGETIKNAKKPVVAYVKGMCCSAGMWVAAQADMIMIENEHLSTLGSIGVLMLHMEYKTYEEVHGVKMELIRSDGSEQKAKLNMSEPMTDELRMEVKAELNEIRRLFVDAVKAGRGDKVADKDVFTGATWNGKKAIKMGLADKVGTLADAYNEGRKVRKRK
jgi:protease IV